MKKIFKSNKLFGFILITLCLILLSNPSTYGSACLKGVSVWAINVFPMLFPFFILTKLIVSMQSNKVSILDKFFSKVYHSPTCSLKTFLLSIIAGYPMGTKLICSLYESKQINLKQAKSMMSFCSVSGPMFMIGTVGVAFLCSIKSGIIILVSNIIASLLNGLIFRPKIQEESKEIMMKTNDVVLSDIVQDSLMSILMVGAYIALSFVFLEILNQMKILETLSILLCKIKFLNLNQDTIVSFLSGIVEITNGISILSKIDVSIKIKTILSSTLVAFSGLSIMMQSLSFLSKLKMKFSDMFKQKFCQACICCVVSIVLSLIFF